MRALYHIQGHVLVHREAKESLTSAGNLRCRGSDRSPVGLGAAGLRTRVSLGYPGNIARISRPYGERVLSTGGDILPLTRSRSVANQSKGFESS